MGTLHPVHEVLAVNGDSEAPVTWPPRLDVFALVEFDRSTVPRAGCAWVHNDI